MKKKSEYIFNYIKVKFIALLFLLSVFNKVCAQPHDNGKLEVDRLMDSLWIHPSSFINHDAPNWKRLTNHLENIDLLQINDIIHSIYFGRNSFILNKSHAYEGFIGTLNKSANEAKNKKYKKKIKNGFRDTTRYPNHKIVLIEGDSWFEYPVFLKDISDYLEKDSNLAIYTLAHGSDWISNMISSLNYEYNYIKVKPDVLIISGGGNDFVGDYRLSNFLRLNPIDINNSAIKEYKLKVANILKTNRETNAKYS